MIVEPHTKDLYRFLGKVPSSLPSRGGGRLFPSQAIGVTGVVFGVKDSHASRRRATQDPR